MTNDKIGNSYIQMLTEASTQDISHPFEGGVVSASATKQHTPLIWEGMLGAVYARNPHTNEIKYFDYKWDAARKFADVDNASDLRIVKAKQNHQDRNGPQKGQQVLLGVHQKT